MNIEEIINNQPVYTANGNPSIDTTRAYKRAAKFFVNWMYQRGRNIEETTERDAAEYVFELYEQGIKREGVNQRIAGARVFFKTAIIMNQFKRENPFANIKGGKSNDTAPTHFFTMEEMKQLFNACTTDRERAFILLMGVEGLRTVEVERMEVKDIDYSNARIKVHGKGNNEDYIYPSNQTLETLKRYIGTRSAGKVFINELDNSPITRQGIKYVVNHVLRMAGLKKKGVSCHALRHSCGTNLYEATKDIRLVQDTLRHKSPEVTARYTHIINRRNATEAIANL